MTFKKKMRLLKYKLYWGRGVSEKINLPKYTLSFQAFFKVIK